MFRQLVARTAARRISAARSLTTTPAPSAPKRPANDSHFQYDMKAPQLDAGVANLFLVDDKTLRISKILPTGFKLSSGHTVYGPLLIVNNEAFKLKIAPPQTKNGTTVHPFSELTPDALRILDVVTPKPEMLVVGGGAETWPVNKEAREYLTSIGISVEMANTKFASNTFNVLAEEGRHAALLAIPAGVKV
ncbi:hypothetical protein DL89DRAFT_267720 [Linderina pennispora]|uniref:NADH dehydrogenase [ubiquinone] 1 alpha subcomplex assembly factor 3 n=1 Tax=Linderina pennispora TaxID=61395 RepID=A0A1Y1W7L8_9FUNG|nr:uncharacterized protein DL89DRAFT_267720 [Linderina pennispora]ORX69523.1 hypothetical protein DL89DRAFT_267720 [Linderina pennispora]